MRKFILTNSIGETWDLQDANNTVFAEPEGLGWEDGSEYVRAGNDYVPLDPIWNQKQIAGIIYFLKNPYPTYFAFVKFASRTPLTLTYTTVSGSTYRVRCRLQTIEKTELTEFRCLECPVTFLTMGLFYRVVSAYNPGESAGGGKVYDYDYNYTYSDWVAESVRISSDSMEDSPCKITIYGPCVNPVWRHYVDGQLTAIGSMTGEVPDGRVLVIDSTTIPYSITEQDYAENITADRYQACDFGTERFFFLKNGSNTIAVSHTDASICPVKVEANISYASV